MINDLLANPNILRIQTVGNESFSIEQAAEIQSWPNVEFAVVEPRAFSTIVNVRNPKARVSTQVTAHSTGKNDPYLDGVEWKLEGIAVTTEVARQLDVKIGDTVEVFSAIEGRPKQMRIEASVFHILPEKGLTGRAVLVQPDYLDLFEAFVDDYSLPEFGISGSQDLSDRVVTYEKVRIHASKLEDVGAVQQAVESYLSVRTRAQSFQIQQTLGLGKNLNKAMVLLTITAMIGLSAGLGFNFWAEVTRRRNVLATFALLGMSSRQLMIFPVLTALCTLAGALIVSTAVLYGTVPVAQAMFQQFGSGPIIKIRLFDLGFAWLGMIVVVSLISAAAGMRAANLDPGQVLREESV